MCVGGGCLGHALPGNFENVGLQNCDFQGFGQAALIEGLDGVN